VECHPKASPLPLDNMGSCQCTLGPGTGLVYPVWQIYSTTRIFTLIVVILSLVGVDDTVHYNCEVKTVFQFFFGYLAIAFASLLIVLRILAIWNKKKIIIAIAAGAWGISVIFQIQDIVRIRAVWEPVMSNSTCLVVNWYISKLNILVTVATDIILLLIMFFGLLRLGFHERGVFGLGRLLWKQGVIWVLVATIAEVMPAVFLCVHPNDPISYMFLPPSMVSISIAATRIHRRLADYATFGCTKHLSGLDSSKRSGRIEWKANRVPITLSNMEVAINSRASGQDQTPQTNQNGSHACIEGQLCEKPSRQRRLDESAENDVESQTQVSL